MNRLVSVGDDFTLPEEVNVADENLPERLQDAALNATYATRASAPFTINTVDADGNPTSITYHVTGGDVTTTYTYGANGVATETTEGATITYTYDSFGNLTGAV